MAITTTNAIYSNNPPAFTGQIMAQNLGDPDARYFKGTGTVTGDAASSSFIINLIDGTNVLPFTPSGCLVVRSGGAATGTIGVISGVATNTILTVTTTAAVNAATFTISFLLWK